MIVDMCVFPPWAAADRCGGAGGGAGGGAAVLAAARWRRR